jgi:hypothetical protein
MTIRVHVSTPDFMDNLAVSIVNRQDDGSMTIYRPNVADGPFGDTWEEVPRDSRTIEPSLRLPHDTGRALLDALAHHYEGAEDTRRLRADYDAALTRSDVMAAVIADVARTLAAKVGA